MKPSSSFSHLSGGGSPRILTCTISFVSAAYTAGRNARALITPSHILSAAYTAGRIQHAQNDALSDLSAAYTAGRADPEDIQAKLESLSRLSGGVDRHFRSAPRSSFLNRLSGGEGICCAYRYADLPLSHLSGGHSRPKPVKIPINYEILSRMKGLQR